MKNDINGFIVSSKGYKENDRIILCITRELGKINLLVEQQMSRRYTNYALSEPLNLVNFSTIQIPNTDCFYYFRQGTLVKSFGEIRSSQVKVANVIYFINYVANLLDYCEINGQLYDFLLKYLELIELVSEDMVSFYTTIMSVRALPLVGHGSIPNWCNACNEELGEDLYISDKGLVYCDECVLPDQEFLIIGKDKWISVAEDNIAELKMDLLNEKSIKGLELYIKAFLGQEIKGYKYLKLLREME